MMLVVGLGESLLNAGLEKALLQQGFGRGFAVS